LRTETRHCDPGSMCSSTVEYASFVFTDTTNPALQSFVEQNLGNAFVGKNWVGLGCYEARHNRIYYQNASDDADVTGTISEADLGKLWSSSAQNPVQLRLVKPIYTSGRGAPDCYSHFRNFDIL